MPDAATTAPLGPRFDRALLLASDLHRRQARKSTGAPYVSHLLAVCALVLEDGGDEDEACAALLHDAVEDQGGLPTLARIRGELGDRVAGLVEALTDAHTLPKPPWRERKERWLARIADAPAAALRLACADKLHNARTLLADLREQGAPVWQRFTGGRDGTRWYLRAVADLVRARGVAPRLLRELDEVIARIDALA